MNGQMQSNPRRYLAGRLAARLFGLMGLGALVAGGTLAALGATGESLQAIGIAAPGLLMLIGAALMLAGFGAVALGQLMQAMFDMALTNQTLVGELRRRGGAGETGAVTAAALAATRERPREPEPIRDRDPMPRERELRLRDRQRERDRTRERERDWDRPAPRTEPPMGRDRPRAPEPAPERPVAGIFTRGRPEPLEPDFDDEMTADEDAYDPAYDPRLRPDRAERSERDARLRDRRPRDDRDYRDDEEY